jgi:hypothetical protein
MCLENVDSKICEFVPGKGDFKASNPPLFFRKIKKKYIFFKLRRIPVTAIQARKVTVLTVSGNKQHVVAELSIFTSCLRKQN